ncbi:MAG: hypothetical protein HYV27_10110 [Candidatus Hydrogenedentes bacterium]|nr:hypothetical protein [Candidatus Hydrogenedentota bacterium]
MNAAAPEIAGRVRTFLTRKATVLRELLDTLGPLEGPWDEDLLERWAAVQERQNTVIQQIAEEHALLLREWLTCEDCPEAVHTELRGLSNEAEQLSAELATRYGALIERLAGQQREYTAQLQHLRKGRSLLRRYEPGMHRTANYLDTQF